MHGLRCGRVQLKAVAVVAHLVPVDVVDLVAVDLVAVGLCLSQKLGVGRGFENDKA